MRFGCIIKSKQNNRCEFENSSMHMFFLTLQNGRAERAIHPINNIISTLLHQPPYHLFTGLRA